MKQSQQIPLTGSLKLLLQIKFGQRLPLMVESWKDGFTLLLLSNFFLGKLWVEQLQTACGQQCAVKALKWPFDEENRRLGCFILNSSVDRYKNNQPDEIKNNIFNMIHTSWVSLAMMFI